MPRNLIPKFYRSSDYKNALPGKDGMLYVDKIDSIFHIVEYTFVCMHTSVKLSVSLEFAKALPPDKEAGIIYILHSMHRRKDTAGCSDHLVDYANDF